MDNLGAIAGPLLALALVGLVGVRTAIALSAIPGLLAALAIVTPSATPPGPSGGNGNRCGCAWLAGLATARRAPPVS